MRSLVIHKSPHQCVFQTWSPKLQHHLAKPQLSASARHKCLSHKVTVTFSAYTGDSIFAKFLGAQLAPWVQSGWVIVWRADLLCVLADKVIFQQLLFSNHLGLLLSVDLPHETQFCPEKKNKQPSSILSPVRFARQHLLPDPPAALSTALHIN